MVLDIMISFWLQYDLTESFHARDNIISFTYQTVSYLIRHDQNTENQLSAVQKFVLSTWNCCDLHHVNQRRVPGDRSLCWRDAGSHFVIYWKFAETVGQEAQEMSSPVWANGRSAGWIIILDWAFPAVHHELFYDLLWTRCSTRTWASQYRQNKTPFFDDIYLSFFNMLPIGSDTFP
jgi:hypothetical protein